MKTTVTVWRLWCPKHGKLRSIGPFKTRRAANEARACNPDGHRDVPVPVLVKSTTGVL